MAEGAEYEVPEPGREIEAGIMWPSAVRCVWGEALRREVAGGWIRAGDKSGIVVHPQGPSDDT